MLSPSHTRPESARPPSRLMSANAARRAIAQLDHITPSAHYTAVGDSPFATSLDHRQVKRWHSVPGVENSPLYFCQSSRALLTAPIKTTAVITKEATIVSCLFFILVPFLILVHQ